MCSGVYESRRYWWAVAMAALLIGSIAMSAVAWAHQTESAEQNSELRPDTGDVESLYSISAEDLAHYLGHTGHGEVPSHQTLEDLRDEMGAYIDDHTGLVADDEPCELKEGEFVALPSADGRVHYHQQWQCPTGAREVIFENRIMADMSGGYRHMARIQIGETIHPTVFDARFTTYAVYPGAAKPQEDALESSSESTTQKPSSTPDSGDEATTGHFVWQGLWHLLFSFHHILFIVALLFAVRRFWSLVAVVTALAVGHSVTLGLSAMEIWTVGPRVIEPLIAATILFVAAKNIVSAAQWRHVWTLALGFGLIHGFGFSYLLRGELGLSTLSLPADGAVQALLAFYLGIELGHLLVVALAFPLMYWLRNAKPKLFLGANRWINMAIAAAAIYWMIDRIFFW